MLKDEIDLIQKTRVFSGIQPTGQITLGNYLGALKQFVNVQHTSDAFYCVVDLHAITVPQDPKQLRERILDLTSLYIAVGLDPTQSTLFVQSDVAEHSELGWILQCVAHMGELSRMTQYKEKSDGKDSVTVGLFTYPTLMAADILLYQSSFVPVGDDQKQHLELTRDIAERFNARFGKTFTLPEVLMLKQGARIMSLDDPSNKMSKSNPNPQSRIEMLDPPDLIRKKMSRAVTDSDREVRYDPKLKPAVSNLLTIYSLSANKSIEEIEHDYQGKGYGDFKKDLAEILVAMLDPIQKRYAEVRNSGEIEGILARGAERARIAAKPTLDLVKRQVGLGSTQHL